MNNMMIDLETLGTAPEPAIHMDNVIRHLGLSL
jgi:hypothetical protein